MATKLKVQNCITDHCNCTSKDILKHYPSERRLLKQQEKDVGDVLALCANNKLTLGIIKKKFEKHMILKNIQNLRAKIKKSNNRGQKDAENTLSFLVDVKLQRNCENQVEVAVDKENILSVVYY